MSKKLEIRIWSKEEGTWTFYKQKNFKFSPQTFAIVEICTDEENFFSKMVDIYIEPIEGITKVFGPPEKSI
jgi:hypothetical protein